MTISLRKLLVITVVGGVFLMGNILVVAHWFHEVGAVDMAQEVRQEFLTGTAITVIIALLILTVGVGGSIGRGILRRCPVCDHGIQGTVKYCEECGSRV